MLLKIHNFFILNSNIILCVCDVIIDVVFQQKYYYFFWIFFSCLSLDLAELYSNGFSPQIFQQIHQKNLDFYSLKNSPSFQNKLISKLFILKNDCISPIITPASKKSQQKIIQIWFKINNIMKGYASHESNMKKFCIILFIIQVFLLFMYGFFVKVELVAGDQGQTLNMQYYPMYQDVNVMMLIGFGFLMVGIRNHSWSALAYTFLINAIVVEFYLLLQPFWHRVFFGGWENDIIQIKESNFTGASYSVASILIAFGAVLGRVGPLELLLMSIFGIIGYTLNESLVYEVLHVYDNGGSTAIHSYGAYFGVTVTFILSRFVTPRKEPQPTYLTTTMAMIGTFFLWMFWPSFNAGVFPSTQFERSLTVSNTVLSLVGSCLGTFIVSGLFRENHKFEMEDILNATLAGGVIIGAASGVLENVGGALAIGFIGGIVSTFCFMKLNTGLKNCMGLYDTCGVHNLHGIPGVLGGILSAIVIASYQSAPLSQTGMDNLNFYSQISDERSLSDQAGIQIAGTFISVGIAILFGLVAGLVLGCVYKFENEEFFEDVMYFHVPIEEDGEKIYQKGSELRLEPQNSPNLHS